MHYLSILFSTLIILYSNLTFSLESDYIQGVTKEQWEKIAEIGDPLNCQSRIDKIINSKVDHFIKHQDFLENPEIISQSLGKYPVVKLENGTYEILNTIMVSSNAILLGDNQTVIDAKNVDIGIYNNGSVSNLTITNSLEEGIVLGSNSDIYNVIISNTGINSPLNSSGHAVFSMNSHSNCIVSVEASYGYNEIGASKVAEKGGNADGFGIKYGAYNVTFIDSHAHHNSDDGFDFWKSGTGSNLNDSDISIRVFYSSANLNGKNPFTPNGDGNGFKFGSWDEYQKPKIDKGARLIYGSAACYNRERGFDRNKTKMKIIAKNLNATGNNQNFKDVPNMNFVDDPFRLKCEIFPKN